MINQDKCKIDKFISIVTQNDIISCKDIKSYSILELEVESLEYGIRVKKIVNYKEISSIYCVDSFAKMIVKDMARLLAKAILNKVYGKGEI